LGNQSEGLSLLTAECRDEGVESFFKVRLEVSLEMLGAESPVFANFLFKPPDMSSHGLFYSSVGLAEFQENGISSILVID
jgi:hypothetical protein